MILVTGGSGLVGSFLLAELSPGAGYQWEPSPGRTSSSVVRAAEVGQVPGDVRAGVAGRTGRRNPRIHCADLVSPQDERLLRVG
jgi:nucleoside-diphosphate-sugar epimerase